MGPWISLFLLQDPFLQNQLGDPASSSPPSSSTCFAPCLHSSPKSWRAVEAIAPAASQSLPPRARTQPVALGLCLKIAQAPAICFCFSRQNTLCFRVSHNRIGCPPPPPVILADLFSSGSNSRLLLLTCISESFSVPRAGTWLIRPETTLGFSPAPPCWWAAAGAGRRVPFARALSYTCSDPEAVWRRECYIIPELTRSASQWALLAQAQTSLTRLYGFCPREGSYLASLQYPSICPLHIDTAQYSCD